MLDMISELTIGSLVLGRGDIEAVQEIQLESARTVPADSLVIKLARVRGLKQDSIKIGDKVRWSAGYEQYGMFEEFSGSVADVGPGWPLVVTARDPMFELMRKQMRRHLIRKPFAELIDCAWDGPRNLSADVPEKITMYAFYKSAQQALWNLRDSGFDAFFRQGVLVVQSPYYPVSGDKFPVLRFGFNVIESTLVPLPGRDICVEIRSQTSRGNPVSARHGSGTLISRDEDGLDRRGCRRRAKEVHADLAGEGFKGTIKTFGYPSFQHSTWCKIVYPDTGKNRTTYIDKVVKTYNVADSSFRQVVHPGRIPA